MPGFLYTNQTNFRPFSYQEMLAPVLMATQAHQAVEEAYSELDSQANAIGSLANEANDPVTYQRYKAYESALRTQADALAKNGLTPGIRQSLLDLKGRYAKDIIPIQNAITRRRELADEQRKAEPTMMFQRDMNSMSYESSLDRFLENPDYDYGEKYSGELLAQQAGQMAANLKTALTRKDKLKGIGLPYQYEQLLQYGYTPEQIQQAITNPQKGNPVLNTIVELAVASSGMKSWASPKQLAKAMAHANRGLYNAIGKTEFKNFTDSFSMQDELARGAETREAERQKLSGLAINPLNIYSSRELSKDEETYKNNINRFSRYFYKDSNGKVRITAAGLAEYNRKNYGEVAGRVTTTPEGTVIREASSYGKESPSEFRKFMDSIGAKNINTSNNAIVNNLGNIWDNYIQNNPSAKTAKYDANRVTEYDYSLAGTQQGDMKDAILTASRNMPLKEVDYNNKTRKFENTGNELSLKDLKSDKYKVTATRFSPYGTTVMIQDNEGNVKRYALPSGINTTNETNRDKMMVAAQQWLQVVNTGQYTDAKGKVHKATPDEITYAQEQYAQALQQAYLFHSQLGVQNKMKEQEFNPYGY